MALRDVREKFIYKLHYFFFNFDSDKLGCQIKDGGIMRVRCTYTLQITVIKFTQNLLLKCGSLYHLKKYLEIAIVNTNYLKVLDKIEMLIVLETRQQSLFNLIFKGFLVYRDI